MSAIAATPETIEDLLSEGTALVDFYAEWCGPCTQTLPHVEKVAETFAGRAKVVKVDIDEHPELAAKYGVRSLPTLKVFTNGLLTDTVIGSKTEQQLSDLLNKHLEG